MHYIPPFKKLRKSFQLRGKEFLRENTLHGFNYFVDASRPLHERVFWLVCTLASFGGAIASIAVILHKFSTKPILTVVHIPSIPIDVTIPSVAVCMSSDFLNFSSTEYANDKGMQDSFKKIYSWQWKRILLDGRLLHDEKKVINLQRIFFKSTPNCDELFTACRSAKERKVKSPCLESFSKELTPAGVCCIMPSVTISDLQGSSSPTFILNSTKTVFLYLSKYSHPNRETPITYTMNRNVKFSVSLQVTTTEGEARLFPPELRGCVMPDESPPPSICYKECQIKVIKEKLNCLPWWLSNSPRYNCHLHDYDELLRYKTEITNKCFDKCLLECDNVWFNIEKVVEASKSTISIKSAPRLIYRREVIFGLLELLVSFGGIMGLFLGYSVLTSVEFFYYFTLRTYCGAIMEKKDINTIPFRVVKPAKPRKRSPLKSTPQYNFYID